MPNWSRYAPLKVFKPKGEIKVQAHQVKYTVGPGSASRPSEGDFWSSQF